MMLLELNFWPWKNWQVKISLLIEKYIIIYDIMITLPHQEPADISCYSADEW